MYRTKFFNRVYNTTIDFLKENSNICVEYPNKDEDDSSLISIADITNNLTKKHIDFMTLVRFPIELKMLYNIVGSANEIIINRSNETSSGFIFLTLDHIMKHINDYEHIVDIAIKYHGMGHWYALTFDRKTKLFFFRMEGGGNGLERETRYKFYKNMNPSNFRRLKTQMFQFNTSFMDNIKINVDAFDFI